VTDARVARRYARALFAAAVKNDIVASVEDDLALLSAMSRNSPEFRRFLHSPTASKEHKLEVFSKLFSDRVTATTMSFIRLVLEKGREGAFEHIRIAFTELRREREGVVAAKVVSAFELTEDERRRLVDKLTRESGKTIEPEFQVDPSLIGGLSVELGNYVLDGTVKGSLDRLRETIIYDLLKQN
jgi:F-type H+-transporting ATPase subunit delta